MIFRFGWLYCGCKYMFLKEVLLERNGPCRPRFSLRCLHVHCLFYDKMCLFFFFVRVIDVKYCSFGLVCGGCKGIFLFFFFVCCCNVNDSTQNGLMRVRGKSQSKTNAKVLFALHDGRRRNGNNTSQLSPTRNESTVFLFFL